MIKKITVLTIVFLLNQAFAQSPFNDGFSKDLKHYLENSKSQVSLVKRDGTQGTNALNISNKGQAALKLIPVNDSTKYTLTFRSSFSGGESAEENPRLDSFMAFSYIPAVLPKRELVFYDKNKKKINTGWFASAMPFRQWREYKDIFYPPHNAAFLSVNFYSGAQDISLFIDDLKIKETEDEGAINCNPVIGKHGIYNYSGWKWPAKGGKIVIMDNGKAAFDVKYGTSGTDFPLSEPGTYELTSKATANGYNSTIIIHFLDSSGKSISRLGTRLFGKPFHFTIPPETVRGRFLCYSSMLEEVRLVRIGDENKIKELKK